MSRQIPGVLEMSQECCATRPPPPKRLRRTCFPTPLSQLCSVCSEERTPDVRLEGEVSHWKYHPDPPTLAFLAKKQGKPRKMQGISLCGTPKILGKERKSAEKGKGNRKTEKARQSKKARKIEGQGRGIAGKFPSERASRYTGVSQLHSHKSRYTVPLAKLQRCHPKKSPLPLYPKWLPINSKTNLNFGGN